MKKDDDFKLVDLPEETKDPEIKQEDFVLQQADSTIHEQRFQTKPTTFLKDSLKRFSKNKSSVVAAYILGILILLSIFVPIFNTNDVSNAAVSTALNNLEPKLFDGGGFWDGTVKVKHVEVDPNNNYYPDPSIYLPGGVKDLVVEGEQYTNVPGTLGTGGFVQFGYYGGFGSDRGYLNSKNPAELMDEVYRFKLDLTTDQLTLTNFVVADEAMMKTILGDDTQTIPENFSLGNTSVEFVYYDNEEEFAIPLTDSKLTHTIGMDGGEAAININNVIANHTDITTFSSFYFRFVVTAPDGATPETHVCSLVRNFVITTSNTTSRAQKLYFSTEKDPDSELDGMCFTDPMKMVVRTLEVGIGSKTLKNVGYWSIDNATKYVKAVYLAKAYFASFTYDSYEATLGRRSWIVDNKDLEKYRRNGWIDLNIDIEYDNPTKTFYVNETTFVFKIKNHDKCPIVEEFEWDDVAVDQSTVGGNNTYSVTTDVIYYKYLGYDQMPKYLFGTDKTGRDMFKYVFEGLRNSLLLGVLTFVICFLFGLLWGSVSGYFGGAVDLVMERVTDILSGVPWIVVMTIAILKLGSSFGTFALALCLTGWIGTASVTRTQFYRFRGREYVLASRTLGASDGRLIAKHILPNALGTIITGAVLMIPSVIFSEATISYLGLGFKNLSSLGVILSNNQGELTNHPYQLLFPSAVIALVMISFNLFGNGLRDAINPSLKGEEE